MTEITEMTETTEMIEKTKKVDLKLVEWKVPRENEAGYYFQDLNPKVQNVDEIKVIVQVQNVGAMINLINLMMQLILLKKKKHSDHIGVKFVANDQKKEIANPNQDHVQVGRDLVVQDPDQIKDEVGIHLHHQAQEAHQEEAEEEKDHIHQVYPDQDQDHVQGLDHCRYPVPQVNLSGEKDEDTKLPKLRQKN